MDTIIVFKIAADSRVVLDCNCLDEFLCLGINLRHRRGLRAISMENVMFQKLDLCFLFKIVDIL